MFSYGQDYGHRHLSAGHHQNLKPWILALDSYMANVCGRQGSGQCACVASERCLPAYMENPYQLYAFCVTRIFHSKLKTKAQKKLTFLRYLLYARCVCALSPFSLSVYCVCLYLSIYIYLSMYICVFLICSIEQLYEVSIIAWVTFECLLLLTVCLLLSSVLYMN